jgi:hypothetical protein
MKKDDRPTLLRNFVDAALALMSEGLSGLSVENALLVAQAQAAGADVVLVFSPGAGNVTGALHFPDPSAEPAMLFRIVVPSPKGSTN